MGGHDPDAGIAPAPLTGGVPYVPPGPGGGAPNEDDTVCCGVPYGVPGVAEEVGVPNPPPGPGDPADGIVNVPDCSAGGADAGAGPDDCGGNGPVGCWGGVPKTGGPDTGAPAPVCPGPDIGGPDMGAPDIGTPETGGPDIGIPETGRSAPPTGIRPGPAP
jgi:hypothetical protein